MISTTFRRAVLPAVFLSLALSAAAPADWPAYRHDLGRSGYTPEALPAELHRQWTFVPAAAPNPAWPDPVREDHQMDFDWANQVVVAGPSTGSGRGGTVYFGSTADHHVHALDAATGKVKWRFATGGAVRFAPTVANGKVYIASDDGYAYCVSAADGKEFWRFRPGPGDERIFANGQMASRWPLRTGLAVAEGKVYMTAGMWALDGVWVAAVAAETGKAIYQNKAPGNFGPQGYLAGNAKLLAAPTGRTDTWVMDTAKGALRGTQGHGWAVVHENIQFGGIGPFKGNENLGVDGAWAMRPRPKGVLVSLFGSNNRRRGHRGPVFNGREHVAVRAGTVYAAGGGTLAAMEWASWKTQWQVKCGPSFEVIAAGESVVVGGSGVVTVFAAADGKKLWSAPVDGEARGLAVSGGRLVVSTDTGRVVCFGPGKGAEKTIEQAAALKPGDDAAKRAGEILKASGVREGYCLLLGAGDGQLAAALASQSKLRVYVAEPDAAKVAAVRKTIVDAGLYGARVVVHHAPGPALPYPEYFADLIVANAAAGKYDAKQLGRALQPCGGVAYLTGGAKIAAEGLRREQRNPAELVTRGPLPGAGEWTHLYATPGKAASSGDTQVRWPLKVLWFGRPGPGQMMNRHLRGTAPLFDDGRMFILGQHCIIAMDAYNGRELWRHDIPAVQRRVVDIRGGNMVSDGDSVYVVTGALCLRFDAASGELRQSYRLPVQRPTFLLNREKTFPLDAGAGTVAIRPTDTHIELVLTAVDKRVTNTVRKTNPRAGDSWEVFFDFRPAAKRTGLYEPGAFGLVIVPATAEAAEPTFYTSAPVTTPEVKITGKLTETGGQTTVSIARADVEKLLGAALADFTFGVILNSSDNGQQRSARRYLFANNASYRVANAWGRAIVDRKAVKVSLDEKLLDIDIPIERADWGYFSVVGDHIIATLIKSGDTPSTLAAGWDFSSEGHDYTGPDVARVLKILGVAGEADRLFVLDRKSGQLLWEHKAEKGIPHNGITVADGSAFVLDRTAPWGPGARRGAEAPANAKLKALKLADGQIAWEVPVEGTQYQQLRTAHGVLIAAGMWGMTAYDAAAGKELWKVGGRTAMHHCSAYMRAPVLTGQWVYDEPHAYDIRTGKPRMVGGQPWKWSGPGGCGTISAAENMLFFRSRTPAMLDTGDKLIRRNFFGIRPGCYINIIAAGGMVLMPEASSGCGCPFNFQTTVALIPAGTGEKK